MPRLNAVLSGYRVGALPTQPLMSDTFSIVFEFSLMPVQDA
ncbi:hypothetical protein JCM19241_988 [Vibrio ishigakensis]|uniref:Uncharacterized protein n=1 Tax=Vibrio ishigakensis TaxID=1481914 RepID=A0A0B8Q4V3_9VIBR|nr:hypothetical protein JCM19241_988 [Vibrio ishigakensis]